jgi:hypothetical protein
MSENVKKKENKNSKQTHHRTKSETTCINSKCSNNCRLLNFNNSKLTIGDLMSGKAFDNNCFCADKFRLSYNNKTIKEKQNKQRVNKAEENSMYRENNNKVVRHDFRDNQFKAQEFNKHENPNQLLLKNNSDQFGCFCDAPRLAPELEFTKTLVSIGKKLVRLSSRELKSKKSFYS